MPVRFMQIRRCFQPRKSSLRLICVWLAGIVWGTVFAAMNAEAYLPLMRIAAGGDVSIVWTLLLGLLPFPICALAVKCGRFWLLYLICFLKAFLFSGGALLMRCALGSAGWLLQPMLQFSELITAALLCFFCLHWTEKGRFTAGELGLCMCLRLLAGIADHAVISPFLAALITS